MSLLRLVNIGRGDANVSILGIDDAGTRGGPVTLVVPAGTATVLGADVLEAGTGTGLSGRLGVGEGRWRLDVRSDGELAAMSLLESPTGHLTNLSTSAADNFVPLLPSASHPTLRGWVRVVNRGPAASVDIRGVDDSGTVVGPVTVSIAAGHAIEFDSDEWENGNASKGLPTGVGRGRGDWRLGFASEGDIQVSAYVETEDGFLANIHDRVSRIGCPSWDRGCGASYYTVAPFHPVGSDGVGSSLRLANDGDDDASVAIWGFDERGAWSGPVFLELAAGTARTVEAKEMAHGGEGLTGWLREGTGTWELRMRVTSSSGRVTVVNLLEDASGHMTNLSTLPTREWADGRAYDYDVPAGRGLPAGPANPVQQATTRRP